MKVEFKLIPVIRVEINHEEDPEHPYKSDAALDFLRWLTKGDVVGFRGCSTGPTGLVKYFEVDDTDQIRAYMLEQGFVEG